MGHHLLADTEITSRLLFELARRVCHVEAAAAVADRKAVCEDVLPKPDGHLGIERLHEAVAKNISGNDVRMSRTKDQIAVRMNPGPVKRHEAALVAKRVEIVREPAVKVFAAQMARTSDYIRRHQSRPRSGE